MSTVLQIKKNPASITDKSRAFFGLEDQYKGFLDHIRDLLNIGVTPIDCEYCILTSPINKKPLLLEACKQKDVDMVKLILPALQGMPMLDRAMREGLALAIRNGDLQMVQEFLKHNFNMRDGMFNEKGLILNTLAAIDYDDGDNKSIMIVVTKAYRERDFIGDYIVDDLIAAWGFAKRNQNQKVAKFFDGFLEGVMKSRSNPQMSRPSEPQLDPA